MPGFVVIIKAVLLHAFQDSRRSCGTRSRPAALSDRFTVGVKLVSLQKRTFFLFFSQKLACPCLSLRHFKSRKGSTGLNRAQRA